MTAERGPELAREAAGLLAACIADGAERAVAEQLVRTHREDGKMPSAAILGPLGRVAARILAGDGTDDAAQYWLELDKRAEQVSTTPLADALAGVDHAQNTPDQWGLGPAHELAALRDLAEAVRLHLLAHPESGSAG